MTLLLALTLYVCHVYASRCVSVYACLHCTVQRLKYLSYLGSYWLLLNLGNYWLLPVSVAIGRTPR